MFLLDFIGGLKRYFFIFISNWREKPIRSEAFNTQEEREQVRKGPQISHPEGCSKNSEDGEIHEGSLGSREVKTRS